MKVYLDDERPAPVGWTRTYTADECIAKLKTGKVEELSLDHDLAFEHYDPLMKSAVDYNNLRKDFKEKTGYDVVLWMVENQVWPKLIILHTMNPAGRAHMHTAIERHAPDDVRVEVRIGWSRLRE